MEVVIIGGSDAGIAAALRARELDPSAKVTVILKDAYPNFSICGIPYYLSGEVANWSNLAHRSREHLEGLGIELRTEARVTSIDTQGHRVQYQLRRGSHEDVHWDRLIIATGAAPVSPPILGLAAAQQNGRVYFVHTIDDARSIMDAIQRMAARRAIIIGAGYIGLELADGLITRGIAVHQLEALPHVLPTIDPEIARLLEPELVAKGVELATGTLATSIETTGTSVRVALSTSNTDRPGLAIGDIAIVVTGVRPETGLAVAAGATLGAAGAIWVDRRMQTGIEGVFAAGDCVITHHRLLGETYLPLGTTAHKQGRVAGAQAAGNSGEEFDGIVGTQVVKVFGQVIARTGLTEQEALAAGFNPASAITVADDHKRYYPGAETLTIKITGDRSTHRLLGVTMLGSITSAIHKRIDVAAVALSTEMTIERLMDLDLAYTPPLGTPWDALQIAASQWLGEIGASDRRPNGIGSLHDRA
ncbi:FAD-dependent oxidoreductase [Ferrimicrobium sp.]|uniref:FAD-dependent oxidoreductase n=1 Tax=Ferrimicrobium sp. TaxID=2926050 RepID=UPI002623766A|nr:FAD-dependent oxidoreductase [Ferrimicrobium sp.]